MNPEIISLGELLVEIMRTEKDTPHRRVGGIYKGPFPSGAPAIFIDSAARMSKSFNLSTGFIGVVGNDEFGEEVLKKLKSDGVDISKIPENLFLLLERQNILLQTILMKNTFRT